MTRRRALAVAGGLAAGGLAAGGIRAPNAYAYDCFRNDVSCDHFGHSCCYGSCCPSDRANGCCHPDDYCANAGDPEPGCCPKGTKACLGDGQVNACCAPGDTCGGPSDKFSCCPGGRVCRSNCCGADERCVNGRCVAECPAGTSACGDTCCQKGQTCEKGKCVKRCPEGRARCGSKCCPKGHRCKDARRGTCSKCARGRGVCGKKCCAKGTRCCDEKRGLCCKKETSQCCQIGKGINPGNAMCCNRPSKCSREIIGSGETENDARSVCCPKKRQVPGDRCCPPGTESNGGDFILRPDNDGVSPFCCPTAQVCRRGRKQTCCNRSERCVDGKCVRA